MPYYFIKLLNFNLISKSASSLLNLYFLPVQTNIGRIYYYCQKVDMPSFDVVSKIDHQSLDNAINNARKEIVNRYDFRGSKTEIILDKKSNTIHILTEDGMKLKAVEDIIIQRMAKQGLDPRAVDFGKEEYASGNMVNKDLKIIEGLDKDIARKITKSIKDLKIKVEPAVMDEQIRVSSKSINDLQNVITHLRNSDFGVPLQFINLK